MTVKELINLLMELPLNGEVNVKINDGSNVFTSDKIIDVFETYSGDVIIEGEIKRYR